MNVRKVEDIDNPSIIFVNRLKMNVVYTSLAFKGQWQSIRRGVPSPSFENEELLSYIRAVPGIQNMGIRLLALMATLIAATCTPSYQTADQVTVVVGTIYVTGNEPFTRLALQAEDGTAYLLKCEKDLEATLGQSQGKRFIVRFLHLEHLPEGPVITVISATPITK